MKGITLEHKCRCQPKVHIVLSNRLAVDFAVHHRPMHPQKPVHSHKRPHSEQPSLDQTTRQVHKKQKVNHLSGSYPLAAVWDNLSKVWLTCNALRELDQRNNRAPRRVVQQIQFSRPLTRATLAKGKEENWQVNRPATEFL
jgi:hypothetical protein